MNTNLLAVLAVLCVACGSRPPPEPRPPPEMVKLSCTPEDCDGCCLDGVCNRIPSTNFCGSGGVACFACPSGQFCGADRRCELPTNGEPIEASTCTLTFETLEVSPARPLTAVWANPAGAWAVGPEGAMVLDGARLVPHLDDAAIGKNLRAVWASDDAKTAWIIRAGIGAAIHRESPSGSSDQPSPNGRELYAVWARNDRDVYVGGGAAGDGHIARWNGVEWRDTVVAADAIIALAGWGKLGGFAITQSELFVETNGIFLSHGLAPGPLSGGIHVSGPRDLWLAGSDGRAHHWQDGLWTSVDLQDTALGGVWGQKKSLLFFTAPASRLTAFDGNHASPIAITGLTAISGTTASRAVAVGDGKAVLGRCATPDELKQSTGKGSPGGYGSGTSGQSYCVTTCVKYGQWGCVGYSTRCF